MNMYTGVPGGKVNILEGYTVGHSKKKSLYKHMSYSERFPIFGAQYFECGTQYFPSLPLCEQSQQLTDASHRFTCFRHWRITVGRKENIARQIQNIERQISETVPNRTHVFMDFFLRMTDTLTSQNVDISLWDMLYEYITVCSTS
jgi:hypothetical protein